MERRNLFLTIVLMSVLLALCTESASSRSIDQIISAATNHDHLSEIQPNGDSRHELDMVLTPEQRRLIFQELLTESASSRSIDQIISEATNNDHLSEMPPYGDFRHELDMVLTPEQRRLIFGEEDPRAEVGDVPRAQVGDVPRVIGEGQTREVPPTE